MHAEQNSVVMDAVLDAWDRSNRALMNLLRALPPSALDARGREGGATVGQMCAHLHHERMVSVAENAPEFAGATPITEWADVDDVDQVTAWLNESASCVRAAVSGRAAAGRPLDRSFCIRSSSSRF